MAGEAEINRLVTELGRLAEDIRDLVATNSALINEKQREIKATKDATTATVEQTKLTKKNIEETTKDLKLSKEASAAKKRAIKDAEVYNKAQQRTIELKKQLEILENAEVVDTKARLEVLRRLAEAQDAESKAKAKASGSFEDLNKHTNNFGKSVNWAGASLRLFGTALAGQARQLAKQYKAAGGVIEGSSNTLANMWNLQIEGLKRGVSGEELINFANANRRVVNALGGTESALKTLDPAYKKLLAQGYSTQEALRMVGDQASDFGKTGIKPSANSMLEYNRELVEMRKYTGLNAEAQHAMFSEVASDTESLTVLKAAREDEREAILASQRALMKQAVAAGMSAEQAKEAAKMLNKMTAAKPLDRLKQAAKIRAMGGALGIAGAEEAAQGVIAGKRATKEQKQAIQDFGIAATNAIDTAAQGGLGSEIFASTLLERLDLEAYLGSESPFSTSLATSMKPVGDALEKQNNVTEGIAGKLSTMLTLVAGIAGVILPGIGGTIMAAAGVIAAAVAAKAGKGMLDKMGGKTGGNLKSGAGKALSLGKGLLKGGVAGATVGLAGNYLGGKLTEAGHETAGGVVSGAATGAGIGATIGSVIPGVGTLIGGGVGGLLGGAYGWYQGTKAPSSNAAQPQLPAQLMPSKSAAVRDFSKEATADTTQDAILTSADKLTEQVKKMDDSNLLLKTIADLSQKQIELSEKQLVALTMTEKERTDAATKTTLNQGSRFGSQYGYV